MPIFSILFIFSILSNISIPFTSSFIPEIIIILNTLKENILITLIIIRIFIFFFYI